MIRRIAALALVSGLIVAPSSWSAPPRPDDDDEERQEKREASQRSFVENCLMCHGEDMTTRQRLTTKQWTAEVEKMVGWGAPLPPERKQSLVDYLAEMYPSTKAATVPDRISPAKVEEQDRRDSTGVPPTIIPAVAKRGEALFATHCAICHGPGAKGGDIGINLVDKPILIRDDEFRAVIREGRRRMPGFATVLDVERQSELLAWLRGQR